MRNLIIALAFLAACGASRKQTGETAKITVSDTKIEILDPITFVDDSADIAPSSTPILDAVAASLSREPSIKLVEIVVHGADKAMSEQRARAVMEQIVARKVAPERLRSSAGDEPATRVAFVILERTD